jgi:AraC-like DNA-binding protein/mannose-6-phosphate isomerase-like protein (cupin superfamily)
MKKTDKNTIAEKSEGRLPYIEQLNEAGWRKAFAGKDTLHPAVPHMGKVRYTMALPELPSHLHRDCLEINCILHGQLHWKLNGEEYSLKPGDCFLSLPNEPHGGLHSFMEPCELFFLQVHVPAGKSDPDLKPLLDELNYLPARQFSGNKAVQDHLGRMFRECESPQKHSVTAQRCSLALLLINVLRSATGCTAIPAPSAHSRAVLKALDYVRNHLRDPATVEAMQKASGLSRSEFFRKFKTETGAGPNQYLLWQRIEAAKGLLKNTGLSITEVAHQLGFNSSQYFATVFRRHTGLSPNTFRRQAER